MSAHTPVVPLCSRCRETRTPVRRARPPPARAHTGRMPTPERRSAGNGNGRTHAGTLRRETGVRSHQIRTHRRCHPWCQKAESWGVRGAGTTKAGRSFRGEGESVSVVRGTRVQKHVLTPPQPILWTRGACHVSSTPQPRCVWIITPLAEHLPQGTLSHSWLAGRPPRGLGPGSFSVQMQSPASLILMRVCAQTVPPSPHPLRGHRAVSRSLKPS